LRTVRFDSIYSSDLQRCLATAEIIVEEARSTREPGDLQVRPDPRLREIDAGLWEGLAFEEAAARYPREFDERELDLTGYRFPGGESFRDLRERVVPAFWEIVEEAGANVLVVAHQGVNRVLLCELLGLPFEELFSIRQVYGCVNVISASVSSEGRPRIEVLTPNLGG
jgi:alpha-ribazole phosphatase